MTGRIWSPVRRLLHAARRPRSKLTVRMTTHCHGQVAAYIHKSAQRGHEGIVYFVGLTNGTASVALYAMLPEANATPRSVDVTAPEIGKIVRSAAGAHLQVVGQLHTHPGNAYHSDGDLLGMRIRYPGYFSIVVPDYGARLPSFEQSHTLMWTADGFEEIDAPLELLDVLGP